MSDEEPKSHLLISLGSPEKAAKRALRSQLTLWQYPRSRQGAKGKLSRRPPKGEKGTRENCPNKNGQEKTPLGETPRQGKTRERKKMTLINPRNISPQRRAPRREGEHTPSGETPRTSLHRRGTTR